MSNLYITVGEVGVGKTNFTLNFALKLAKTQKITLVDLDTSNLYFRLSEFISKLKHENIEIISPNFAHSTQEVPSLSGAVESALRDLTKTVIVDTAGGDFGITILSRYREVIKQRNAQISCVVNQFRKEVDKPQKAADFLKDFERRTGLHATNLVNNSHLGEHTTANDVKKASEYAKEICELYKINLLYNCVSENLAKDVQAQIANILPVKILNGGRL